MNNKALLNELTKHLTILEYHVNRLKKKPEQLHEIDIEVMGEKLKEIYTLIHSLDTGEAPLKAEVSVVNEVEKVPRIEVKPEPEIPAPKAPEMSSDIGPGSSEVPVEADKEIPAPKPEESLPKDPPPSETEMNSDFSEKKKEEKPPVVENIIEEPPGVEVLEDKPSFDEVTHDIPETSKEKPVASPEPTAPNPLPPTPDATPKTTADLFSGPTTIADTFQAADDNSIAAKTYPQVEQDLKMAIGINDKFLFINELFKGDPGIYNQAIETLNSVEGINDAETAIETYRGEYAWADNSEAYHRLKNIVMSKYDG